MPMVPFHTHFVSLPRDNKKEPNTIGIWGLSCKGRLKAPAIPVCLGEYFRFVLQVVTRSLMHQFSVF